MSCAMNVLTCITYITYGSMRVGELPRLDGGVGFKEIFSWPLFRRGKGLGSLNFQFCPGGGKDGEGNNDEFWRMFGRGGNARKGIWRGEKQRREEIDNKRGWTQEERWGQTYEDLEVEREREIDDKKGGCSVEREVRGLNGKRKKKGEWSELRRELELHESWIGRTRRGKWYSVGEEGRGGGASWWKGWLRIIWGRRRLKRMNKIGEEKREEIGGNGWRKIKVLDSLSSKFIFLDPNQQQGSKHNSALIGLIEVSLFIQPQIPTGLNMWKLVQTSSFYHPHAKV